VLGLGSLVVGVALIWVLVVRGSPVEPDTPGPTRRPV
jgi:hypothetical protein